MPTNESIGASLEIPQSVLDNLEKVDNRLQDIAKSADTLKKSFVANFKDMADGVNPLINKLTAVQGSVNNIRIDTLTEKLSQSVSGAKDLSQGFDNTAKKAEQVADSVVKISGGLAKVQSPSFGKSGQNIAQLTNDIDYINQKLKDEESQLDAFEQQSLVNIREGYKEELKEQQKSTEQKIDALTKELDKKKELLAKAKEANLQSMNAEINDYEKKLATERAADEKYQQGYISWLNKRKEEESKKTSADSYQEEYNNAVKNEQKILNAVAKAENEKRKEREKTVKEGIEAANKLEKAEERKLAAQAKLDSMLRRSNYLSYVSSYEGSLRTAEKASDINSRTQAIKNLEAARAKLKTTDSDYANKLAQLNAKILEMNKLNAQAIAGSKDLNKSHNKLIETAKKLAVRLAILYGINQIRGFLNSMVEVRANMELQQRSLESILQNKTKADALFQQVTTLAVRSPFTIQELISYTKQLAAYRIETENLYDTTKMLADVSAGLGVDMQRLILAYGQVKAANYLRGQELRQFSEAGINILGELAEYFGEINNKAYTTADIFDMVSKRMVKFEDVANVFKRMTSEGGIFFNMQEVQAETLQGQLSNLRDSMDMMFNDMGKANDGVMKDAVGIARTMMKNWQVVADVLKAVVLPSIGLYIIAMAGVTAKQYASIAADEAKILSLTGVRKATYGVITSLKTLQVAIASNPITAAITAAVAAATALGVAIHEVNKRVAENRAEYDDLNKSIYDNLDGVNSIMNAIKEKNVAIASANQLLHGNAANERDVKTATEASNQASAEKTRLIEEFKEKYPEYYEQVKDQIKTTDGVTEAQERLNKQMETSNYLMFVAKNQESVFSDGFIKSLEKTETSFAKVRKAGTDFNANLGELRNTVRELTAKGLIPDSVKEQVDGIANSSVSVLQKIRELYNILGDKNLSNEVTHRLRDVWGNTNDYVNAYIEELQKSEKKQAELAQNAAELAKYFFGQYGIYSKQAFDGASEAQKKNMEDDAINFLSNWKNASEDAKKIIAGAFANFGLKIPISFSFGSVKTEIDFLGRQINDYISKNLGATKSRSLGISFVADGTGKEYLQSNIEQTKALREELKQTEKAASQLNEGMSNKTRIKELRDEITARENITRQFGLLDDAQKKTTSRAKAAIDYDKERLSLLKQMKSQYDDLLKYYTAEEAKQRVLRSNQLEMNRLRLKSTGNLTDAQYLKELNALKKTKDVIKEISDTEVGIDIKIKKESIDKAKEEFERMFSDYDFAVSLDESGIDKSLFSDILGNLGISIGNIDVDETPIVEIFKKAEEQIKTLRDADTEESIKLADEEQKKLEERKIRYAEDTAKKYLEYTKKSISERLNIELDAEKKIAQVKKDQSITGMSDAQVNAVIDKMQKDKQKALDALSWKDFKESDLYVKMFEDLEHVSTSALEKIKSKLADMRKNLSSLDPTEVKEIANSMDKVDEQLVKRNPFKGLTGSLKEYLSLIKKKKETEEKWMASTAKEESIQKEYDAQEKIVIKQRESYQLAKRKYGADSEEAKRKKLILEISEQTLDTELKRLVAQKKITQEEADKIRKTEKAEKTASQRVAEISQHISEVSNGINEVASNLENVFGTMSDGMKDALDSVTDIANGLSQTGEGIANIMSQNYVSGGIQVISGLTKTIGSIFAIGDKKKEREIQKQLKLVGKLQDAYEELEKAINSAYSIDQLKTSTDQAKENIMSQISAYNKMIKLENDKKKTDKSKIEEYKKAQDELREQLKDLEKSQLESLGGIADNVRSTTRDFVDAWYDAFTETGDGLSGLEDKFNDMFINIIKEQAALKIADKFLKPLYDNIDKSLEDYEVTTDEANALKNQATEILPKVSDALTQIFGSFGALENSDTELSGLQRGIQGVTEETAQALESLLNSTRFFVADSNKQLQNIYQAITSTDVNANPLLAELKLQTAQVTAIN